jgi:hypothetical protein
VNTSLAQDWLKEKIPTNADLKQSKVTNQEEA